MKNQINKNDIYQSKLAFGHKQSSFQRGLSLIELMISMVIGLFLLAGVVTVFIGTKDSDKTRDAISNMDANASLILETMRKTISHAGYVSIDPVIQGIPGFHAVSDGTIPAATCKDGNARESDATRAAILPTADIDFNDRITIISLADNPCLDGKSSCPNDADADEEALVYYDCLGGGQARDARTVSCSTDPDVGMGNIAEARIYSSFSLIRDNTSSDRSLVCIGSRSGDQSLPIAENVEAVQYLYGIREANDSVTFKNADAVDAANDWEKVRSVQVALLLRSSYKYLLKEDSNKTFYSLLDKKVDIDSGDLKRLFRVYTTTINLENMN